MRQYLDGLQHILDNGKVKTDRTGAGTKSVFGYQMRFDLSEGFPAVTTKKLAWRAVVSELLWFLEGSGDERRLCEILHGTRDSSKTTIWTENAQADYWLPKAQYEGDLGRVYGVQMRSWLKPDGSTVDQILNVVDSIKKDPSGRRHLVINYNPGEINQMALPPCHVLFQFDVTDGKLSCQMYQRSSDTFLGVPFNIASYSLLTHMIAHVCDLEVGDFVHTHGDFHVYLPHIEVVKEQLGRLPLALPTLWLNPEVKDIRGFTMDDCKLIGYNHHPALKAAMMV
jgi:thymidylate synthase